MSAPDLSDLAEKELAVVVDGVETEREQPQGAFDFEGPQGPDLGGAARRAVATEMLVEPMRRQLEARGGTALYEEIELPLIPILARMSRPLG